MSTFRFRHFTVHQSNAAMKVGTDSMLLGSLCTFDRPQRILDIGTGTGVLALMTAQRFPEAHITGVELDPLAATDARLNIAASPWKERLEVVETDVRSFLPEQLFDGIVSNPPYFVQSSKSLSNERNRARHTDELPFGDLMSCCAQWLSETGTAWIIVPHEAAEILVRIGQQNGLHLLRRIFIDGKPGKTVRAILCFGKRAGELKEERFTVRGEDGTYSDAYIELTRDFHHTDLRKAGQ